MESAYTSAHATNRRSDRLDVVKVEELGVLILLAFHHRVGVVDADVLGELPVLLQAARLVGHVPARADGL